MENQIKEDLKKAQLARDEKLVSTLRMLLSELTYARVKKGPDSVLEDNEIISVVQKELKKRQESIDAFEKGGRPELAANEQLEVDILKGYLPPQLSEEELTKLVEDAINETGASSMSDMGKVIGMVMAKVGQSATSSQVSSLVKQKLTS
jgi:uncharacterized protein YqeY